MSECTVQLWYNKQRPKKNGTVSLYLQIIVNAEHDEIPLKGLSWPVDKIDWLKKELKPRRAGDDELVTYNAIIERERAKYWKVVMSFITRGISFTLSDIFREVNLYKNGHQLCAYMEYAIRYRQKSKRSKERIKESSSRPQKVSLGWLRKYLNDGDVEMLAVDAAWLERYADYLRDYMCENTVWARIKDIKTYLSFADANRIVVNPDYKRFTIKYEETSPTWLEPHEVKILQQLYRDPNTNVVHRRNLRAFLFACFTGLRISDLSRWSKDWIKGGMIEFLPVKRRLTKKDPKPLRVPLLPFAWEFINSLENETLELPSDQVYNRELKELAEFAGLNKNLTSHVARHTYATSLALSGVPEQTISSFLGHKSTVSTKIYTHLSDGYKAMQALKLQQMFEIEGMDNPPG